MNKSCLLCKKPFSDDDPYYTIRVRKMSPTPFGHSIEWQADIDACSDGHLLVLLALCRNAQVDYDSNTIKVILPPGKEIVYEAGEAKIIDTP